MRWLVLCFILALPGSAMARDWVCDGALAATDRELGQSDTHFKLSMNETGHFRAERTTREVTWVWQGQWTVVDGQIAMIGAASQVLYNPMNRLETRMNSEELRAFSSINEDCVIILNLVATGEVKLLRCLKEGV